MCVLIVSTNLSEAFVIISEIRSEMCVGLHVQWRQIVMKLDFSRQIAKNVRIPNFMKILLAGAELLQADRRTGMTKLILAFFRFCESA